MGQSGSANLVSGMSSNGHFTGDRASKILAFLRAQSLLETGIEKDL
jgi:hypothetical protein